MLPESDPYIESMFPRISDEGYEITSPQNQYYNCIAWAAGDSVNFWWPHSFSYWPEGVERTLSVDAFVQAYATVGYEVCESPDWEEGHEKIAIFVDEHNIPQHASRQLSATKWTSKLGPYFDISHSFSGLNSEVYGHPAVYLKRQSEQ